MAKSYADLRAELDEVLSRIQSPNIDIDDAVAAYEEGEKLIRELEKRLQETGNKLKKLQQTKGK